MQIYDIISNLKFVGIKNYKDIDIESLSCNSDEKLTNGIFFCIKGFKQDGHNFAFSAVKNGAVCLVVEKYLDLPIMQILVENVREAMSHISSIFYSTYKSKMKFIGVTGTNGKTTTTFILREILHQLNKKVGLIGTVGIYINSLMLPASLTTPDPIDLHKTIADMENNGCEYCIMEVSAHAIALNKIDDVLFDSVGLTNITKDHLDFFLTMENYIKCKASLFDVKHAKTAVVNIDAKNCKEIAKKSNIDITTIGKDKDADIKLVSDNQTIKGTTFSVEYKGKTYHTKTNLIGEYNLSNLMMAISILNNLGFSMDTIFKAIKNCEFNIPGRFNVLNVDAPFSVVVDYAHTPDGMKNILSTIKNVKLGGRIITVFGCGGDRDKTKRGEMGKIASTLSDIVIVTSDNPRSENPELIIDDIVRDLNAQNIIRIENRKSAIEYALSQAKQDDIIAILGKGAETYQEIFGVKIPFSDYDVVDDYFKYFKSREIQA